ncbi:MAG TPA: hypothetical protein VFN64_13310 [Burkholderiaceae bacterium]|nr:hypothetical protein [Burkholderiaceae bacterium]
MSDGKTDLGAMWWSHSLSEVDKEVARLATICYVPLLDPGVVERVLANDASVCGTSNALAFEKLRNVLMMHYAVRTRAAEQIGQAGTNALVMQIVEELKQKFGDRLGTPPATK